MNVIAKKTLLFKPEASDLKNNPDLKAFTLRPSPDPQPVPDWVAKTDLFKLAEDDKDIIVINGAITSTGTIDLTKVPDAEFYAEFRRRGGQFQSDGSVNLAPDTRDPANRTGGSPLQLVEERKRLEAAAAAKAASIDDAAAKDQAAKAAAKDPKPADAKSTDSNTGK